MKHLLFLLVALNLPAAFAGDCVPGSYGLEGNQMLVCRSLGEMGGMFIDSPNNVSDS